MTWSDPALGIDVGGSGIKLGFVDLEKGILLGDRIKIDTPLPATPESVATVIKNALAELAWQGETIGVGFPAIIQDGVSLTATNIDKAWIGVNVEDLFASYTGHKYKVINDADAAGLAERMYGRILHVEGTAIMLTLGTGIGSALFYDGVLVPNTELGSLIYREGLIAEKWVSNQARKDRNLEYDQWAKELADFLDHVIRLFSPRLIVLGGGISFRFDEYAHHFNHLRCPVVNAMAYNDAGIIGAAVVAYPELLERFV